MILFFLYSRLTFLSSQPTKLKLNLYQKKQKKKNESKTHLHWKDWCDEIFHQLIEKWNITKIKIDYSRHEWFAELI